MRATILSFPLYWGLSSRVGCLKMESRMKNYRQLSPERAKVWTEKSPKYHQFRKVPVIYYLCKNRQLDHPHFMEVPISSPDGLYLRDVIQRLNVLRGRGMASMYSWSSKRSYKNGFVWHDLSEDDLIHPAHGNEFVLKGSELFEESSSDQLSPVVNVKLQNLEPPTSRCLDDSSSSSSMNEKERKHSQEEELSSSVERPSSSVVSPDSSIGKSSSWVGSLSLTEYKTYKNEGLVDASTQTEEDVSKPKTQETCARGVSTDDDGSLEPDCSENFENRLTSGKANSQILCDSISPPRSSSSPSSTGAKTETLETLIRADASKINSFRILEGGDLRMPTNASLKATNFLMQLISCGSISVKDHNFGFVPTYKPLFSTSMTLGELDCLTENSKLIGLRLEDKEYFSGSLVETKALKGDGHTDLKRSSSCNADRICKQSDSKEDKEEATSGRSKCILRSIKASLTKQPRSESVRSPLSDKSRKSSERADCSKSIASCTSSEASKRSIEPSLVEQQSNGLDSFKAEEEVFKIEERLASGARVIIQSKGPWDSLKPSWT